jgi:hypothetical protein
MVVVMSCCAIDDDIQPRRPCHEHADCIMNPINNHSLPPPSIHCYDRRRKMMRQRGTIKKAISKSALLLTMHTMIFGCHASSDHDDEAISSQLQRRLQGVKPWLPDNGGHRCTNDQKREPWMPISKTIQECCSRYFNWDQATCGENSSLWYAASLNPFQSSTTQHKYYLDPFDGSCKLDSPQKPGWISVVVSGFEACCAASWDYEKCKANEPVIEQDMQSFVTAIGPTTPKPTTSPTKNPYTGFYADDVSRKCLPNSANKPAWNTNVASTHLECCKKYLDWAYRECVAEIPPTLRPTAIPTSKPTAPPTNAPVTAKVSVFI